MGKFRLVSAAALAAVLASGIPTGAAGDAGTGVDRIPRSKTLSAAREIDRLIEADLAANGITPNPLTDDAAFVRRAYLDLVGRVPTAEETSAFLSASDSDKREALVDRLLDAPGYASHMFNWLADLLRVKSRLQQVSGEPYIHFIKESLAQNKPWDVFVREMLTASGNAHRRGNGATGYYLRDRGMVEDNMSNTITIFLGTRLECAQCHNHPFDKWKQLQYHEMVAFTGGMRFTDDSLRSSEEGKRLEAMGQAYRGQGRDASRSLEARAFQRILQPLQYGISGSGTGLYRLPKDYQYEDAKANQVVKAKAMFGNEVTLKTDPAEADRNSGRPGRNGRAPAIRASDVNSREAYARWLTSAENPRFTTVIANRLWKRLFGAGVIEPVDNLKESTKAANEPLLKHLEKTMTEVGFDVKQFLRVLTYSRTYQREASRKEASDEEPYRFPGPLLRRMSAEQLWDSVVTLVVPDVDGKLLKPGEAAEPVYAEYERILAITDAEIKQRVELEVVRQKDPAKFRELQRELSAKSQELRDKSRKLQESLALARKKGDEAAAKKLEEEIRALEKDPSSAALMRPAQNYRRGRGDRNTLARASDLEQPAPPGHFLREFGQSDREQIEASHTQSAVPQALSLLNGFVDKSLLPNKSSAVRVAAAAARSSAEKVRAVFLSIVNRDPAPRERDSWVPDVEKRGDAAIGDLMWTLVNTHEFMFIR